jgi:DNA-binding NarL/FixJ family response regulator
VTDKSKISVLLIEDHEQIRNGLTFLINASEGFSCTSFPTAELGLEYMDTASVDVVLMDINLPSMSGIECTRIVRERFPKCQVIMCTVYEDDEKIFRALEAGANGYLLKKSSSTVLLNAIRDVMNGSSPMSGEIARKVVESFRKTNIETEYNLTSREMEILNLLSAGFSNKELATKLFVSPHTVRNHLFNIYEKLHVHCRIDAMNKLKK